MNELIEAGVSQRQACRSISARSSNMEPLAKERGIACRRRSNLCAVASNRTRSARTIPKCSALCNSEQFCNSAPRAIVAALLDEGRYLASASTFYRILGAEGQVNERRAIATHPARVKPELMPKLLTSCGHGISPNSLVQQNGRGSASISYSTSLAVSSLRGKSPRPSRRR